MSGINPSLLVDLVHRDPDYFSVKLGVEPPNSDKTNDALCIACLRRLGMQRKEIDETHRLLYGAREVKEITLKGAQNKAEDRDYDSKESTETGTKDSGTKPLAVVPHKPAIDPSQNRLVQGTTYVGHHVLFDFDFEQ